jgi:tagaturonate epimerase
MELEKYSIGIGDRFDRVGAAQLRALQQAVAGGVQIVPVWNKSNREHLIVGSSPDVTRKAIDEAVRTCRWTDSYYHDADHIGLATVDAYLDPCDYFTIDIADYIGRPVDSNAAASFLAAMAPYRGLLSIPGMQTPVQITDPLLASFAQNYLFAIGEAGKVYRHIAGKKDPASFITEMSVDEARNAQQPVELLLILAAVAREKIPIQTIAPKFRGSFLKGIDYMGDVQGFTRDFHDYLAVIKFAVNAFDLPRNLKLSIHTGSDKFSIYPVMHRAIKAADTGLHLKTAGTTWLQEIAGIAVSGGAGLALAKEIYRESFLRYDALCEPYLAVIRIVKNRLPPPQDVAVWSADEFVRALHHDPSCESYSSHLRQLMHIGFKVAAEKGDQFAEMREDCRSAIEDNVTSNIYEKHIRPLFMGSSSIA